MEVIVIESGVWKELVERLERIESFVVKKEKNSRFSKDDIWLDTDEVADMLRISTRTLQRRRDENKISYSKEGGRCLYQLSEIERLLKANIIKSDIQLLEDYFENYTTQHATK